MGEAGVTRTDYVPSENDLDLVEGVASQQNAMGYFGFAYYEQDIDRLRAVAIDNGNGCVLPSAETIASGSYAPLSRPLYLYVNRASLERPEAQAFLHFTFDHIEDIVRTVQYVPLTEAVYAADRDSLETLAPRSGSSSTTLSVVEGRRDDERPSAGARARRRSCFAHYLPRVPTRTGGAYAGVLVRDCLSVHRVRGSASSPAR